MIWLIKSAIRAVYPDSKNSTADILPGKIKLIVEKRSEFIPDFFASIVKESIIKTNINTACTSINIP